MPSARTRAYTAAALVVLSTALALTGPSSRDAVAAPGAEDPPLPVVATIGVVSFNAFHDLSVDAAWHDARDLTGRAGVDVIGWQEMELFDDVLARLHERGFESQNFPGRAGEDAVSWRSDVFELVEAERILMHEGVDETPYPIPPRYVVRVVLRHRASGRLLTVLNTHANHKTENLDRPGHPLRTLNMRYARGHFARLRELFLADEGSDWTVGTADLNVDQGPDRRVRYWGFPFAQLRGVAVSSWTALGARGMRDTFSSAGQHRKIDYVLLARRDVRHDASFVSHRVLTGMRSDHRPVLARIELRAEVTAAAAP